MTRTGEPARVLIAEGPHLNTCIRDSLSRCEVMCVRTFADAERAVHEHRFNLVIIDLQFAEGRMLDFLQRCKGMRVVCVQGTDRRVRDCLRRNMSHAVKALGGKAFFDLRAEEEMTAQTCDYLRQILALPESRGA